MVSVGGLLEIVPLFFQKSTTTPVEGLKPYSPLRLTGRDSDICLRATSKPEFDAWRWHDYWIPLDSVIEFKRGVYEQALSELVRFLEPGRQRAPKTKEEK